MPKYIENLYIQHYLEVLDKAVDAYVAARNRGDWSGIRAALKEMKKVEKWIETRAGKISAGNGDQPNGGSGWNPDGISGKKPPAAVRAEEE